MVFRHIVQHWLRNAAREKVRQTVVEAARQQVETQLHAKEETSGGAAEEPQPCDVGAVFALEIEAGCLADLLEDKVTTRGDGFLVRQGTLNGRRMALVLSGPGCEAAAKATEALIAGHRPQWVLSAGLAGGLSPDLRRHDILMADQLADTSGNRLSIDLKVDPAALAEMPGVHVGRLLTAGRIIRLPEEKRSLGQQHEALAVDMETFAVAEVCRRHQVRFLAVRVINDAVDDRLPPDVERLLAQKSTAARLGAAMGAIWHRPASFKDMYQLKENALLCSLKLAKFLAAMTQRLGSSGA